PGEFWTHKSLGKVATVIGNPLHMDNVTLDRGNDRYARVLVELDISQPHIREFQVTLPSGLDIDLSVVYEFEPRFCDGCENLGHSKERCLTLKEQKGKSVAPVAKPAVTVAKASAPPKHGQDQTMGAEPSYRYRSSSPPATTHRKKSRTRSRSRKPPTRDGPPVPPAAASAKAPNIDAPPLEHVPNDGLGDFEVVGKKGKTKKKNVNVPVQACSSSSCTDYIPIDECTNLPIEGAQSVKLYKKTQRDGDPEYASVSS
ncbi:hypothetical protein F511_12386, partial [Dorcoceras hygrometricum]